MIRQAGKNQLPGPKPFVKWAGGKRQLLPIIADRLPEGWEGMTYYEPFLGGGAVLFGLRPAKAVVSDLNSELMDAYRTLESGAPEVINELEKLQEDLSSESYYNVRGWDRRSDFNGRSMHQRAARLIYLNRTCYNGLYRVNSKGYFNVPMGDYRNPAVLDGEGLQAVGRYLRENGVRMLCGDFEDAVKDAGEGCFAYFDPPYHAPNANFTSYQSGGFGEDDQKRLAGLFEELSERGVNCLLSNSDTPFVRKLYGGKGYKIERVLAVRAINSRGDGRGNVCEVLVRNYECRTDRKARDLALALRGGARALAPRGGASAPAGGFSVDDAWKIILEERGIPEKTRGEGVAFVDSEEFGRLRPGRPRGERLMVSFGTTCVLPEPFKNLQLSILPVARGRYALGRFKSYFAVPPGEEAPRRIRPGTVASGLSPEGIDSERKAVSFALEAGLLSEVFGGEEPALKLNGRIPAGSFEFRIGIEPGGAGNAGGGNGAAPACPEPAQVKLTVAHADLGTGVLFETDGALYVLEARNVMQGELFVRRLYYPWRHFAEKSKKPVVPVYMVFSNDVFSFYVCGFGDPGRYDSIRVERTRSFSLGAACTLEELDAVSRREDRGPPPGAPFPQADSFGRVVDLLGVLRAGELAPEEVTRRYGFVKRQTDYYLNACAWLGLAEKLGDGHGKRDCFWRLTGAGAEAMSLGPGKKRLALASAVLARPVYNEAWRLCADGGAVPDHGTVMEIIRTYAPKLSDETVKRRSHTVRSWLGTLLGWTRA
jgi:DNA adenine methylase